MSFDTAPAGRKLLVVHAAALGHDFFTRNNGGGGWNGLQFAPMGSVFPALTCPAQACFRTASPPAAHGMVANGLMFRDLGKVMFWEQSSRLVHCERIWSGFRQAGGKVAMLFWQQSFGEEADYIISPAPVHKHHGGLVQDCYSKPHDLYARLCASIGRPFNLFHYWGPLSSMKSTRWIVSATEYLMRVERPGLCLTYLPHLDYCLQRHGPSHPRSSSALGTLMIELGKLVKSATAAGYEIVIYGDYSMVDVTGKAVYPNKVLRSNGLLKVRNIRSMVYPDLFESAAFAVADHEIANVYLRDKSNIAKVKACLENLDGVEMVLDRAGQERLAVWHENSGELLLIAREGNWFAYPWWDDKKEEPDFARHIDIHNKPGYDPCELFFGWPPFHVSQNHSRVKGTHGRGGKGRNVCFASSVKFDRMPADVVDLGRCVGDWLSAETVKWR